MIKSIDYNEHGLENPIKNIEDDMCMNTIKANQQKKCKNYS
jgi:hypothetical protein